MISSYLSPRSIHLDPKQAMLSITWSDGSDLRLSGQTLRQYCACSNCRAKNIVGKALVTDSSDIVNIKPVGYSGLQIVFADGHDRGVFPWHYLQAIAAGTALEHLRAQ